MGSMVATAAPAVPQVGPLPGNRAGRVLELDGIRGWAALSVVLFHLVWEPQQHVLAGHLQNLWLAPWLNGSVAVMVFFILSGDALSHVALAPGGTAALCATATTRYTRLTIPILASTLAFYAVQASPLNLSRQAGLILGSPWLSQWFSQPIGLGGSVYYALWGVYLSSDPPSAFNPVLWTMSIEMVGSMLVFLVCFLRPHLLRFRLLVALMAAAFFLAGSYLSGFMVGLLFAQLRADGAFARLRAAPGSRAGSATLLLAAFLVSGLFLIEGLRGARPALLASVPLVLALHCNQPVRRFLSGNPLSRFLGRISFPLYLTHTLVLITVASAGIVHLDAADGLSPVSLGIVALIGTSCAIALAVAFAPVETLTRAVNRRIVRRLSVDQGGSSRALPAGRTVLVFEPEHFGHQLDYAEAAVRGLCAQPGIGRIILLTTPFAAAQASCQQAVQRLPPRVELRTTPGTTRPSRLLQRWNPYLARQHRHATELGRGLDSLGADSIDFVVVPHFESLGLIQAAVRPGIFRGRPWATIAVAVSFHHVRAGLSDRCALSDRIKACLFRLVVNSPSLACFGSVDPTLAETEAHPKIAWTPEPVERPTTVPDAEIRRRYGIPPAAFVVLVFGYVDRRKNLGLLLEAMALLDPDLDAVAVVLGHQSPEVKTLLAGSVARDLRERGRLRDADGFVTFTPDTYPLALADVTWTVYDKNFVWISSVLSRSAAMGRPVLGRNHGLIGRTIERTGCGLATDAETPAVIAAALAHLARDPDLRRRLGENGRRAFRAHTPEAFIRPIARAMAASTGARP